MGDGMDCPGIGGIALDGAAARRLGCAVVAAFLEPEGMHAQEIAMELMIGRPGRQHPGEGIAHDRRLAQIEIGVMGEAQRPDVAGMIDQDLLPDPRRQADLVSAPGIEGRQMGSLPGREPRLLRFCLGQAAGDARTPSGLAREQPQHAGQNLAQDEIGIGLPRAGQDRQGIAIPAEIFARRLIEPGAAGLLAQGHGER